MILHSGIGTYLKNLIPRIGKDPRFSLSLIINPDTIKKETWLSSYSLYFSRASIYSLKEQIHLPKVIPSCDLFWSPHFNAPLLPTRAKKRVVTLHDVYHLAHLSTLGFMEKIYTKTILPLVARRTDTFFTVSQFSSEEIQKHLKVNPSKIEVISNGAPNKLFISKEKERQIKDKYSLPDRFFLFVGNCKPHKNLRGLIEAFSQLQDKKIYLLVVGKVNGFINGENISELIRNKNLEKQVQIFSEVTDEELPVFYSSALALVFPSFYEGFGLPPLEAMTYGCPVIVSEAASLPEVCQEAALYFSPSDTEKLSSLLREVEKNPGVRDSLQQKGFRQALKFSWDISAEKHTKVLYEICARS
jgi:glycosyltransferase involved in cell wall biosynthesis